MAFFTNPDESIGIVQLSPAQLRENERMYCINSNELTKINQKKDILSYDDKNNKIVAAEAEQEIQSISLETVKRNLRDSIIIASVLCLFIYLFYDEYKMINAQYDSQNAKDHTRYYVSCTFGIMAINLIVELTLEYYIKEYIPPGTGKLYAISCCIRGIMNNISLIFLYIYGNFAFWWEPVTVGLYLTDLLILFLRAKYFTKMWKIHMISHHMIVGLIFISINHTVEIFVQDVLLFIMLYLSSTIAVCIAPVWRQFKMFGYEYASSICFVLQRIIRWYAIIEFFVNIPFEWIYTDPYNYWSIIGSGIFMELIDTFFQLFGIIRYFLKRNKQCIINGDHSQSDYSDRVKVTTEIN